MKNRKLLALLTLLMVFVCLSGCINAPQNDPTPPAATPTTPPTSAPTAPPKPAEPVVEACGGHDSDPYVNVDKEAFYADYSPACCYTDACYRTEHYLLSGIYHVPGQFAEDAPDQPKDGQQYIRNTAAYYLDDGNTYVVLDSKGNVALCIYKGAAYITLEEVAAYLYAFGGSGCVLPANYISKNSGRPASSPWGELLRLNHSKFTGNTRKYPYEPELPNIDGCGGALYYFEVDIGTTGTTTPGYSPALYNNGQKITRGAARIVYTRCDLNRNGVYENDEVYVFYTDNHYNDFREYLNYYGGWGQIFGNMTGGGSYSSKTDYNPTPYPETAYLDFWKDAA